MPKRPHAPDASAAPKESSKKQKLSSTTQEEIPNINSARDIHQFLAFNQDGKELKAGKTEGRRPKYYILIAT